MKNLLILLAFILGSCEIQPKTVQAEELRQSSDLPVTQDRWNRAYYGYTERNIENMTYGIWFIKDGTSQTGYCITTINITKDMLEVQLLRKQLTSK